MSARFFVCVVLSMPSGSNTVDTCDAAFLARFLVFLSSFKPVPESVL